MGKVIKVIAINKETVIVLYGLQYLCFNNFGEPRKSLFRSFKEDLNGMRKKDLGKILALAGKYEVKVSSSRYFK